MLPPQDEAREWLFPRERTGVEVMETIILEQLLWDLDSRVKAQIKKQQSCMLQEAEKLSDFIATEKDPELRRAGQGAPF